LSTNEAWAMDARRDDMNHFMTRLVFCFSAEDTDIFSGDDLFAATVEQMSDSRSGNAGEVISKIFQAMNTPIEVLERIYIGRCFNNDSERLEKLLDLYTKMTAKT
jgi:hypothetical protein